MRKKGSIVLLTARPETVYERVKQSTNRPVLNGHMNLSDIGKLMEKRRARYEEVADFSVATDGRSVREICGGDTKVDSRKTGAGLMGNFEFLRECRMESEELQAMYDAISGELERAEREYRKIRGRLRHHPARCGGADLPCVQSLL